MPLYVANTLNNTHTQYETYNNKFLNVDAIEYHSLQY